MITLVSLSNIATFDATILNQKNFLTFISICTIAYHVFHINCTGLLSNWDSFYDLMCQWNNDSFSFDRIGIRENYQTLGDTRLSLNGYHDSINLSRDDGPRGGVGLFLKDNINFKILEDISVFMPHVFESLFVEAIPTQKTPTMLDVIFRPNSAPRVLIRYKGH